MKTKLETAINKQINIEFYSSYLYLAMAAYAETLNLKGFANWLIVQSKEEITHAMKFYNFVYNRGGSVVLNTIQKPPSKFKSPLNIFKETLAHEKKITGLINNLYELAVKEKDYPAQILLQWFIDEQVEEEKNASEIIEKFNIAGEKGPGLILLDQELAGRVFVDETAAATPKK